MSEFALSVRRTAILRSWIAIYRRGTTYSIVRYCGSAMCDRDPALWDRDLAMQDDGSALRNRLSEAGLHNIIFSLSMRCPLLHLDDADISFYSILLLLQGLPSCLRAVIPTEWPDIPVRSGSGLETEVIKYAKP